MVAVGRVEPPEVVAFGVPLPLQPASTSDSAAAAEATATMLCFFIMCAFPFGDAERERARRVWGERDGGGQTTDSAAPG